MLIVQKYGGSSLQTVDRVKAVAERIGTAYREGHDVVVVCSAMGDTSDELIDLARQVTEAPPARELDMLLTTGERVSTALLAMALDTLGIPARSLSGEQAGVLTDSEHGQARILEVAPRRIREVLSRGQVPLVAGFQGASTDTQELTTLGRGGSDVTAVALAAALKADICEIYTDVDGVYSADPRLVPGARLLDHVGYEEMLELAACGARVLMARCVEYARRHGVELHVRSSYTHQRGTFVIETPGDVTMEQPQITGVAHDRSVARITVERVHNRVNAAADVFEALAADGIPVDMVLQNVGDPAGADVAFTVAEAHAWRAVGTLQRHRRRIGFHTVRCDTEVGKVSVVGAGLPVQPGAVARFCRTLALAGVGVEFIATSDLRISAICREDRLGEAVRALHSAFDLDTGARVKVYAGTGR